MIEVLKQALDALETEVSIDWTNNDEFNASAEKMHDAIASLHQAIAELKNQEQVSYSGNGTAGRENTIAPTGFFFQMPKESQEPVATGMKKLTVTLQDRPIDLELAQYKRMFEAACSALGAVSDALGCDPEEGGAEPLLIAIEELKSHPPQRTWQGLTQSDFNEIYDLFANKVSSDFIFEKMYSTIEAKLKQKNGFAEEKNT